VGVLDEERNYKKRLISEIIHIKKQKLGLNSQNDTELLDRFTMTLLFRKLYTLSVHIVLLFATQLLPYCISVIFTHLYSDISTYCYVNFPSAFGKLLIFDFYLL